jgi:protease-4
MKGSTLLSTILQGEFLIDCHNVGAYYAVVDKILAGQQFNVNPQPKSILNIVNAQGKKLKRNEEGKAIITPGSFAIVKMHGEVIKTGDYCVYGADEIVAALTVAEKNPNIAATIFDIDGPGGAVNALGLFQEFKRDVKSKPIIGLCDSALSLHYWTAALVCDQIIAANDVSARFGSIGVVLSFADNIKAMKKAGYTIHEIYPEESKHKNLAFKHARKGDYKLIKKEFLSPLAIKFQNSIKANRPNLLEEEGVLSGKTFFADEALRLGLIDGIGGMKKAINIATIMSSTNNY